MASYLKTLVYVDKHKVKSLLSTVMSTEAILITGYHDTDLLNLLKPSESFVPLRISVRDERIFIVLVWLVKLGSW